MAALVFLAGAGVAYYNKQCEIEKDLIHRIEEEKLDFENSIPIKLLPLEVSSELLKTARSTITFFKLPSTGEGEKDVTYEEVSTRLQHAVIDIVQKNKWISGFIAKRPSVDTEYQLWYTPSEDPNITVKERGLFTDVLEQQRQQEQNKDQTQEKKDQEPQKQDEQNEDQNQEKKEEQELQNQNHENEEQNQEKNEEQEVQPFSLHSPYSTWLEMTKELRVVSIEEILNRKSTPLWRVSILPTYDDISTKTTEDNNDNKPTKPTGFALFISMCHTLGDYHTFYQLYGMVVDSLLLSDGAITKLNPFRHPDFEEQAAKRLGYDEVNYLNKTNPTMWESKPERFEAEALAFTVSKTWINDHSNKVNTRRSSLGQSRFVDATIISWFFNLVRPTIGFYANSLRDFLDVIDDMDCGNYINPIPMLPEDYATAYGVQHSLLTGKRSSHEVPLPHYFDESGLLTFAFAVNWLGHANKNTSWNADEEGVTTTDEGSTNITDKIQQELHMPLYGREDLRNLPSRVAGMVIFEPTPGEIGLYCFCKKSIAESIIQSGIIDKTLNAM